MAPKKSVLAKRHRSGSTTRANPPPPDDGRPSNSTTSRYTTFPSFRSGDFPPKMLSSTSPSRTEDGRPYVLPRPSEWPQSYESYIPTYVSGLAPLCFSGVGGSSSRPRPSTKSINCGTTTMRSTRRYLWPPTLRA